MGSILSRLISLTSLFPGRFYDDMRKRPGSIPSSPPLGRSGTTSAGPLNV